jgi:hypothetical protein
MRRERRRTRRERREVDPIARPVGASPEQIAAEIAACDRLLAFVQDEIDASHARCVSRGCVDPVGVLFHASSPQGQAALIALANHTGAAHHGQGDVSSTYVFFGSRREAHALLVVMDPQSVRAHHHALTLRAPPGHVPLIVSAETGATRTCCWPISTVPRGQA